jgi:hypothetical protein
MEMSVGVLDHYNVSTRKLEETMQFYENVLRFVNGPRPQFNFLGAWLYSAGHAVLHLNDISQTDRQQRPDSGVIDHIAFSSRGFEAMKRHLAGKDVPYRANQVPNSTRWQIFLRDPNNVEIELNFETKNEVDATACVRLQTCNHGQDTAALQPEISVAAATTGRDAAICRKHPAAEGRSTSPPYAKFERFSRP